jgi:hypothetical protein
MTREPYLASSAPADKPPMPEPAARNAIERRSSQTEDVHSFWLSVQARRKTLATHARLLQGLLSSTDQSLRRQCAHLRLLSWETLGLHKLQLVSCLFSDDGSYCTAAESCSIG